jgi:hypothetical protein
MESVLQGSLRHFPVGELLAVLGGHGHTGTLEIQSKKRSTRVVFEDGKITWGESNDPALKPADDPGAHVERIVLDLFSWIGGRFTFSAEAATSEKRVDVDAAGLISKGAERAAKTREALKLYPNDQQRFNVVEDPASKSKISLSPQEFKILMKIGDGTTLEELCEEMSIPCADLYPMVRNLHTNGLIAPMEAKKEAPAKPAERPEAPRERKEEKAADKPAGKPDEKVPSEKPAEKAATAETSAGKEAPTHESRPSDPSLPVIGSLTEDGEGGAVYPLIDDEHTLGRDSSNSIPIVDGSVSGKHARIFRTNDGFNIEDLKSRNGTFVNGERVTEKKLLGDNDLIRLGKVILMFNIARESDGSQTMGRRE